MKNGIVIVEPADARFLRPGLLPDNKVAGSAIYKLAGALKAEGYKMVSIVLGNQSIEDVVAKIVRMRPRILGLSCLTATFDTGIRIAEAVKQTLPEVAVVLGGYHISEVPSSILDSPAFNVGVVGLGEAPLLALARYYCDGQGELEEIPQLLVPDHTAGSFHKTGLSTLPATDNWAWSAPNLTDLRRYRCGGLFYPSRPRQTGVVPIVTAQGCPNSCKFCSTGALLASGHGTRCGAVLRDPHDAARELRSYLDKGINTALITTPSFNLPAEGMEAQCQAFIDEGLHDGSEEGPSHLSKAMHMYAYLTVGITEAQARLMARAGISVGAVGVEAVGRKELRQLGKPYGYQNSPEAAALSTFRALDSVGIISRALFMFPGTTDGPDSLKELLKFLTCLQPDVIRTSWPCPSFGTLEGRRLREAGMVVTDDRQKYDHNCQLVRCEGFTPGQLTTLHNDIASAYYCSPEYRAHVEAKVREFPHLRMSFHYFFSRMRKKSEGRIDLRFL